MIPHILHIYGPLYIQSYGLAIVIGIVLFTRFFLNHPKREKYISTDEFFNGLGWIIVASLIGGHLLYVITSYSEISSWQELLLPWNGLSVLGAIVGGLICAIIYFHYKKIPMLPVLDIIAIYLPLVQAFGRVGCFFAGCCHGIPCSTSWAITYLHPDSQAPLGIPLHPSQLYSACALTLIFVLMYTYLQYQFKKPGQLFGIFLMLTSLERIITDFWRYDHVPTSLCGYFSTYQQVAWLLFAAGLALFIRQTVAKKSARS